MKRGENTAMSRAEATEVVAEAIASGQYYDPIWRIQNLYRVKHVKTRKPIKPILTPIQMQLVRDIYDTGAPTQRHVILKARQVFMTTVSFLLCVDRCATEDSITSVFSSFDEAGATMQFHEKAKFIVRYSPLLISMGAKAYKTKVEIPSRDSAYQISMTGRGENPAFVHLSEYGKTCAWFPEKAREVRDGLLQAAEHMPTIIESTSMGAGGDFHKICMDAYEAHKNGRDLLRLDFKFHFCSWFNKEENVIEKGTDKYKDTPDMRAYFTSVEDATKIKLSKAQRQWYSETLNRNFHYNRIEMQREHPSTPEEAFKSDMEGSVLLKQIQRARMEERIVECGPNELLPTLVFWDLGKSASTAYIAAQADKHGMITVFSAYKNQNKELKHYLSHLEEMGIHASMHILPHDALHKDSSVKNALVPNSPDPNTAAAFKSFGHKNIHVMPKLALKAHGFNASHQVFPNVKINVRLQDLINDLEMVTKEYDRQSGQYMEKLALNRPANHYYDCIESMCVVKLTEPWLFRRRGWNEPKPQVSEASQEHQSDADTFYETGMMG